MTCYQNLIQFSRLANFLFVHGGRRKRKFRERKEQRRRKEKEKERQRKEKDDVQAKTDLEEESAQLKFKRPTPAPFLVHFSLPMEDKEVDEGIDEEVNEVFDEEVDEEADLEIDLKTQQLHEQVQSGCVGAWEEDGTLWRSHEPPPSQGHIAEIPQIRAGGGEGGLAKKEMLVPSPSLLPPHLPPSQVTSSVNPPVFHSVHHPEDSFVQSQIRRQQEEALARQEVDKKVVEEVEEEEEEENKVVEPLMRLVEAIFSLPTVKPRVNHQPARQGRKKSGEKAKLASSGPQEVKKERTSFELRSGKGKKKALSGKIFVSKFSVYCPPLS